MTKQESLDALRIDRSKRERGAGPLIWAVLVAAVLVIVGLAGWRVWDSRTSRPTVRVVTVQQASGSEAAGAVLNASGYVTARRRATVSSKITGKVIEVRIEEGKAVRQGDVLARLDPTTPMANLHLTEAQLVAAQKTVAEIDVRLKQARITLARFQALLAEGIGNQADVDASKAEVDALEARLALTREQVRVAERQVELAKTELDNTVITAPFSGVAVTKDAQPGEMVSPVSAGGGFTRTGICTIVDMSSLEIDVDVNESYINRVTPGQRVEAVLDAYPDWKIAAHVITTVPTADRQKATVLVRVAFDRLDPRLLPDMGVKVAFLADQLPPPPQHAGERGSGPPGSAGRQEETGAGHGGGGTGSAPVALVSIPKSAVRNDAGQDIVFVFNGDRIERRAVRLGATRGDSVDVLTGLSAGERIVVESSKPLADGQKATIGST